MPVSRRQALAAVAAPLVPPVDYANSFRVWRKAGHAGGVGMEHGTLSTPKHAWDAVKAVAGLR